MFLMFLAAGAAAVPTLGEPIGRIATWFRSDDVVPSNGKGAVRFKVLFAANGTPERCVIEATTGNAAVERLTCAIVGKRFRYQPSQLTDGTAARRILVRAMSYGIARPADIGPDPFYSLTVRGYDKVDRVAVVADIGEDGSIKGCGPVGAKADEVVLAGAVCRSVSAMWQPLVELDAGGKPIRYVRDIPVEIRHAK